MKDTKKKHNSNNIISWIATFILLASAIATIFNYIDLKKSYNTSKWCTLNSKQATFRKAIKRHMENNI